MKLEDNINKMYLLKAVKWFMILMPIIVLFFEKHGLSLTQIMILQATYSFTVALFEIPSGFFADIYGRRLSLFFGSRGVCAIERAQGIRILLFSTNSEFSRHPAKSKIGFFIF